MYTRTCGQEDGLYENDRVLQAYTRHPTPYTLHPTPYTLHPTPYPQPSTLNPQPPTLRFVRPLPSGSAAYVERLRLLHL